MDDEKQPLLKDKDEEGYGTDKNENVKYEASSFKQNAWLIFSQYLDSCTMTGIPFIRNAESKFARVAWSLLLFSAICVMISHLVMLFASYFQYNTFSEVIYTFSALPFPAVTICNVNPIRVSQKHLAQPELEKLIDLINPNKLDNVVGVPLIDLSNTSTNSTPGTAESSAAFDDFFLSVYQEISKIDIVAANEKPHHRLLGSLGRMDDKSMWHLIMSIFKHMFAEVDEETRYQMGHQLNDMVLQCYYNGYNCDRSCFKRRPSLDFGNCYTLECNQYYSTESGPDKGLTLVLRMEMDEYIPTISEGKGAQLVIHERNTLVFPEEDGIALSAGTDTMIGIRQVEVSRLQEPYGKCSPNGVFKEQYGVGPTRNTCLKACEQNQIRRECGCYEILRQEINPILNMSKGELPCSNMTEVDCVMRVESSFGADSESCGCSNPCSERKFEKTVSMRQWPSNAFSKLLVASVCMKTPGVCELLKNKTSAELKEEFLRINIYFEDLNSEKLSEKADYALTQFLSDIGGTIGLWIGLSLLGLCEVLHLVIELGVYGWRSLCSVTRRKRNVHPGITG